MMESGHDPQTAPSHVTEPLMTFRPASDTRYPLLALIDTVRGTESRPFSTDPQAAALERRARELTGEYWPEQIWLTGNISSALLLAVTHRLEAERDALHERIHVMYVTEQRSTPIA
jgi:hypothetical protein